MSTVSFRFLPFTRTVSPRNSWSVSIVLLDSAIIELSSLTASVTLGIINTMLLNQRRNAYIKEFGFFFFFNMAVAVSSTYDVYISKAPT
jgi:hypothetical protein